MKKLISKIVCAVMALTLITGIFTGCKANTIATKAALPSYTSVKDSSGSLPSKETVGDMEYSILEKEQFGCYNKARGYYIDMLEQLDSPYYIVISAGTKATADIEISDFGMQGSTLVIVVEESKISGDKYTGLDCPCAVLEVNNMPSELLIVSTTGEQFEKINPVEG